MFDDWIKGYPYALTELNVKEELLRHKSNPLDSLLGLCVEFSNLSFYYDRITRVNDIYSCFYMSLQRFLREMSIAVRWNNSCYYKLKHGGKYTDYERKLADEYNSISSYLHMDFYNCLLYMRILMDAVIGLSPFFLKGLEQLPSTTSFSSHKKFLKKNRNNFVFKEYANYICDNTDWFNVPLKLARDKAVVHHAPEHVRYFGFANKELVLSLHKTAKTKGLLGDQYSALIISIPQLARDINTFLVWYNAYGMENVKQYAETGNNIT